MNYYYITKRKSRGLSLRYAGDGYIEAKNRAEAREIVAYRYGVAKRNIKLEERPLTFSGGVV